MLLWHIFVSFIEKKPCTNFCGVLIRFHEVKELQSLEFSVSDVIPANAQNISPPGFFVFFVSFMKQKPCIKLYDVFNHFSRFYEIAKFWRNKLYLNLNDVMLANEHTIYAKCGLHLNFRNFLLILFCFAMKKDPF